MGETTDSIRRDIDRERGRLEDNIHGIESRMMDTRDQMQHKVEDVQHKVKEATDWRTQFDRRPMVGLAVAFGGGVLLASMMGGGNKGQSQGGMYQPQFQSQGSNGHPGYDAGRQHVSSTFDNVKGALLGVAAAQLKTMLSQSVPGFDSEYRQIETESKNRSDGAGQSSYATRQSQSGYPGGTSERRQEM
ncbi:MAG TPA: DUF3618 domain-containing protein [Thermomicrobiales bacterium]|nr:DUF3618 domain-containing protein [Thermomicrobiales bacterium]